MKPNERDLMSKVFVKAIAPHRQKVLQGDKEMRLQQLANRMMADQMRESGQSPTGDMFTQGRDKLMRDMVMNPEAHNIKFMGERVPFEGQTLGSSLSVPDVAGEQADIDETFSGSGTKDDPFVTDNRDETLDFTNEMRDTRSAESYKTGDTSPKTAQEKLLSEILDEKGNLKPASQFMDNEDDDDKDYGNSPEEQQMFDHLMSLRPEEQEVLRRNRPQSEDELLDRMARKAVNHISSFRDAWSVLKL